MAMFYGTVQGGRGEASRLGHANSGLRVSAQSYDGSVIVKLYTTSAREGAHVNISVAPGSSSSGGFVLYDGPVDGLFSDQFNLGR